MTGISKSFSLVGVPLRPYLAYQLRPDLESFRKLSDQGRSRLRMQAMWEQRFSFAKKTCYHLCLTVAYVGIAALRCLSLFLSLSFPLDRLVGQYCVFSCLHLSAFFISFTGVFFTREVIKGLLEAFCETTALEKNVALHLMQTLSAHQKVKNKLLDFIVVSHKRGRDLLRTDSSEVLELLVSLDESWRKADELEKAIAVDLIHKGLSGDFVKLVSVASIDAGEILGRSEKNMPSSLLSFHQPTFKLHSLSLAVFGKDSHQMLYSEGDHSSQNSSLRGVIEHSFSNSKTTKEAFLQDIFAKFFEHPMSAPEKVRESDAFKSAKADYENQDNTSYLFPNIDVFTKNLAHNKDFVELYLSTLDEKRIFSLFEAKHILSHMFKKCSIVLGELHVKDDKLCFEPCAGFSRLKIKSCRQVVASPFGEYYHWQPN